VSRHSPAPVVVVVVGLCLLTAASTAAAYADDDVVFRFESPEITESSSLFVSTVDPSLAYTANDSGDGPVVYAADSATGSVVGRMTLHDVTAVDIEALAGGQDGTLVVADIGDNNAVRDSVTIYRVPQPGTGDTVVPADAVELTYADGPRDAESALYDATSGRVYIASKELTGASVYVSPPRVFEGGRAVLQPIAGAPSLSTDATLLRAGEFAVIRSYGSATVYRFPSFKQVASFGLPALKQGESIAAPPGGDVVWVGTEGERSPVVAVRPPPLPGSSRPPSTRPPSPRPPSPSMPSTRAPPTPATPPRTPSVQNLPSPGSDHTRAGTQSSAPRMRVGLGVGIVLLLVTLVAAARRRRRT